MAVLDIILEGDPRLRQQALKIKRPERGLVRLAADMHETMDSAPGVGLAGPQVGVMRRIIVIHVPEDAETGTIDTRMTLLNPEIIKGNGREEGQEGCLSIPNWVGLVPRFEQITVRAINLEGKKTRFKASGFLARVIQHEVDHLDGILFVDRVEDESTLFEITDDESVDAEAVIAE